MAMAAKERKIKVNGIEANSYFSMAHNTQV
jgi:hypothetical protein